MGQQKGFEVRYDGQKRIVFLKVWGPWKEEDGKAYLDYFRQKIMPIKGTEWDVVADISEFPPQSEAVN